MTHSRLFYATAITAASICTTSVLADSLHIQAGENQIIESTLRLDALTIDHTGALIASDGYDLTMTVNGISTPIKSGAYIGEIVLTPTREYLVDYRGYPAYHYRAALVVRDGELVPDKSVIAAAGSEARADNRTANDVAIVSNEERFNGIIVAGDSRYTINNLNIDMTGNGGNDFAGWGAGVMSTDTAHVTINGAKIRTHGAIRTALFIGGKSTMVVNDADIETFSGSLPEGYTFSIAPGEMMEVPYGLGLEGNVRATNLIDEATVYYNNCRVKSHGWGALSSDGNGPTRMFVNNCVIETEGSGYGAYANGDSHDYFSHSIINVTDVGVIVGGPGWVTLTDATELNSDKLGVMMHQGAGGSLLRVEKKSAINSRNSAVQIKGRGADVVVDDATLNARNGILVQTMENDDPIMREMMAGGPPPGGPGPGGPGAPPGPPGIPGGEAMNFSKNVNVTLRNTELSGTIAHAMGKIGEMNVYLQNTTLTGAISTSTTRPSSGQEPTRETFRTVGEVTNDFHAVDAEHGLNVFIDQDSVWMVANDSFMDSLVIADGATIQAEDGKLLALIVDGRDTPLQPGAYTGKISLNVR